MFVLVGLVVYILLKRKDIPVLQHSIDSSIKLVVEEAIWRTGLKDIVVQQKDLLAVKESVQQVIVGMDVVIDTLLLALLCNGHVLLEGVPGLAKTKTIRSFADALGLSFKRIQFTPDMLPSDIVWTQIYNPTSRKFTIQHGPIVAQVILADEINRTTPKVQSALLEAMQEWQVTIDGHTIELPYPFIVLATQNPIDQEGTYPLPEAQIDRFMFNVLVDYPDDVQECEIVQRAIDNVNYLVSARLTHTKLLQLQEQVKKVVVTRSIQKYITKLVRATRNGHESIMYGASPRWSVALTQSVQALAFLQGRQEVKLSDVHALALVVLRHRIVLQYSTQARWVSVDDVLVSILSRVDIH